jgi:CO dehydrogenase maturation factor
MCDTPGHHHHDDANGVHHAHEHVRLAPGAHPFRVVVTGKGGVGKTSLTALLARQLARRSYQVLALDADPQMNLPYALGLSRAEARALVPLGRNLDYVEEKTGARPGTGYGLMLRLNPDVDDVVDRFGVVGPDGVRLVVMGTVVQPATGCLCPENALLSSVIESMRQRRGEAILLDTQAGVEHFGRALARGFRHALVVTDATFNAVHVALQAARLSAQLGIPAVHLVVNRVADPERELERVREIVRDEGGFRFASEHVLPWDARVMACEPAVGSLMADARSPFAVAVARLGETLVRTEQVLSCES